MCSELSAVGPFGAVVSCGGVKACGECGAVGAYGECGAVGACGECGAVGARGECGAVGSSYYSLEYSAKHTQVRTYFYLQYCANR